MPASSKKQSRFMYKVLECKTDSHARCSGAVKKAAESMSTKQIKDFTSTKTKNLPEKKGKK